MDQAGECGVNVVLGLIGSKWKPTILWQLGQGTHRFADLRRAVVGVSEKVLAAQLRELERDGLVTREQFPGFPLRVEYQLTPAGAELDERSNRSLPGETCTPRGSAASEFRRSKYARPRTITS